VMVLKSFATNSVKLTLSLSAIAILMCFVGLKLIYAFHILNPVEDDYLLAVANAISIIACIWFYRFYHQRLIDK
jgi:divalent metal cation (Fe/Co/Zn/Cd) transporter